MGKDNQPKVRQAAQIARKVGRRASCDRILIVCEGSKTEPLYLDEIRTKCRIHTANVQVQPSEFGTTLLQVVEYVEHLFVHGDATKSIEPRAFEQVYAVFDRDGHATYFDTLSKSSASGRKKLRNDLNQPIRFSAIASVPCFELWLLLHFEEVLAPVHRTHVYRRIRHYLPSYDKGQTGLYEKTCPYLNVATQRAKHLTELTTAYDGARPYTDLHRLVDLLATLKS